MGNRGKYYKGKLKSIEGPNGIIYDNTEYRQPEGIHATCHLHDPPIGFKTIEELQKHELENHRVWKG